MSEDDNTDSNIVNFKNFKDRGVNKIEEDEEITHEDVLAMLYYETRECFEDYIDDPKIKEQAVNHLRAAILLAINPIEWVDKEFDDS